MLSRDQVLHVATLARLSLDDAEVDRMASELSRVLDHIDKISELDLDGVQPTAHVVDLDNVLRPDEPSDSLPVDVALAQAPDGVPAGFRVPSPTATETAE